MEKFKFALESEESHLLVNPKSPKTEKEILFEIYWHLRDSLPAHIWLSSSGTLGTESEKKLLALSYKALKTSAQIINEHIKVSEKDAWINVLPLFHVGGLSIYFRALAAKIEVHDGLTDFKWNPFYFVKKIEETQATLTSLVPTQVFDLVSNNLLCPSSLRLAFIGGSKCDQDLYKKARRLKWPLLPTYGLSECSSQVATASLESLEKEDFPSLEILPHVQVTIKNSICLNSISLFTGYGVMNFNKIQFVDPKVNGFFISDDHGEIIDLKYLNIFGRKNEQIKIFGEMIDLLKLRLKLKHLLNEHFIDGELLAPPHPRNGHELVLVTPDFAKGEEVKNLFNQQVAPYERISQVKIVKEIPRSVLGKTQIQKLLELTESQQDFFPYEI